MQSQEVSPVNQRIRILGVDIATQMFHMISMNGWCLSFLTETLKKGCK
jgi:hypothetical protein